MYPKYNILDVALHASPQRFKGQMNQNFDFALFLPNLLIKSQINIFLKFQSNWTLQNIAEILQV